MNLPNTAAILVDERLAVSQYLVRFAEVVTHIAAFAHDRVDDEVPAGGENVARCHQSMAAERLMGMARDGFADMAASGNHACRHGSIGRCSALLNRAGFVSAGQGRSSPIFPGMQLSAEDNPPYARKWRHSRQDGFR